MILLNFMFGKMRISHHLLNLYDWVLCKIATSYTSMEAERFSLGLETLFVRCYTQRFEPLTALRQTIRVANSL
jgi:hypothetical protein